MHIIQNQEGALWAGYHRAGSGTYRHSFVTPRPDCAVQVYAVHDADTSVANELRDQGVEVRSIPIPEPGEQVAPRFNTDDDLIKWLDKLYECDASGAIRNQKWSAAQRAIAGIRTAATTAIASPQGTFEQAWAKYEAQGYKYGPDALQNVKFGWEIAHSAAPERRVWQMPEGASLVFSIKDAVPLVLDIRAVVSREPTVGKWYAGVDNSQPLPLYGATARYEGEGRWYLGTSNRIDLYQYDYLQELV